MLICATASRSRFTPHRSDAPVVYAIVAALLDELAFWPTGDDSAEPDVRGDQRAASRHGDDTGCDVALRIIALRAQGRVVRCASQALRQGRRSGSGVARPDAGHEPARSASCDRRSDGARPRLTLRLNTAREFRSDIASFVERATVEACVAVGVRERAPLPEVHYVGFVDPSGGSADAFTLSVGHKRDSVAVIDAIREVRPPFSPESVVIEFVDLLKRYRVSTITGDRYAGEWPREAFRKLEVQYELSERPKSAIYQDFLPLVNSGQVELLDHPRLVAQLCSLERRTARGGRDSIDHPPGAHDDIANVVAGVVVTLGGAIDHTNLDWICGPADDVAGVARHVSMSERAEHARRQLWAHVLSDGR